MSTPGRGAPDDGVGRRQGVVAWADPSRGVAFISPDGGGADLFVEAGAMRLRSQLDVGLHVAFDLNRGAHGRRLAANVVEIVPAPQGGRSA